MICASVPALKAFFVKFLPRFLRTSRVEISGPSGNQDRHENNHHQDWRYHFKVSAPRSNHYDIESSASRASLNKTIAIATPTGQDLSDDGEARFRYHMQLSDDLKLGRMSPAAGRADGVGATTGKMEIMVHRTFETMTIETEVAGNQKSGDLFPGYP